MTLPLAFAWLRERRRAVMWLVVLVVVAHGMAELLGRGVLRPPHDWSTAINGAKGAAFSFLVAWGMKQSAGGVAPCFGSR